MGLTVGKKMGPTGGKTWQPLPRGGFTGTDWSAPGAINRQDPYLAWAEADGFAGYARRHPGHAIPAMKWLPIAIELAPGADVAALVAASRTRWLQISRVYLSLPGLRYCSARVSPAFFKQLRQRRALRAGPSGGPAHPRAARPL